jgi:hypothetical protein
MILWEWGNLKRLQILEWNYVKITCYKRKDRNGMIY